MGQSVASALLKEGDISLDFLVDHVAPHPLGDAQCVSSLEEIASADVDVVVDFSTTESGRATATWCIDQSVALVMGTTGFSEGELQQWARDFEDGHAVIAANFAIGAILLQRFAAEAARYFPSVEIIEYHHDAKADAPSGTAIETARQIATARHEAASPAIADPTTRDTLAGSRGAEFEGIRLHAVRLPGLTAHQDVLFGGPGEGLTIRHDAYDRSSFSAGVLIAVRHVRERRGLTVGLSALL
jgi:4-hydroxy-tetrahydrodipicolinate reductase